jgi:hypothetical protein
LHQVISRSGDGVWVGMQRHANSNRRHASYSRKTTIARTPAKAGMTEVEIGIERDASSSKGKVADTPAARSLATIRCHKTRG